MRKGVLFFVAFFCLVAAVEAGDKKGKEAKSSGPNLGVVVGIVLGCVLPLMVVNAYQGFDNGPESSEIDELTSRTFFDVVGNDQPSVVLFHELEESTSQEFRWSYEEIYDHFMKKRTKIIFAMVDQSVEQSLSRRFGTHLKGSPTLLWFAPNSKTPVFYSSPLMEAKVNWIIDWIQRRFDKGSVGDATLLSIEQLIAEIYHWFDGYDCSETEQLSLDNSVEEKSWLGRMVHGHEASVYGEVLPDGIQTLLDYIEDEFPLGFEDVIVDLGSGTGKVVLHVALATPCKKCLGIELSETRHKHGVSALANARELCAKDPQSLSESEEICFEYAQKVLAAQDSGRMQLILGDIMQPTYSDATHLYAASTTWPAHLMHTVAEIAATKCPKLKTFSTLQPFNGDTMDALPEIHFWKTVQVAVSWQDTAPMHMYTFGAERPRRAKSD